MAQVTKACKYETPCKDLSSCPHLEKSPQLMSFETIPLPTTEPLHPEQPSEVSLNGKELNVDQIASGDDASGGSSNNEVHAAADVKKTAEDDEKLVDEKEHFVDCESDVMKLGEHAAGDHGAHSAGCPVVPGSEVDCDGEISKPDVIPEHGDATNDLAKNDCTGCDKTGCTRCDKNGCTGCDENQCLASGLTSQGESDPVNSELHNAESCNPKSAESANPESVIAESANSELANVEPANTHQTADSESHSSESSSDKLKPDCDTCPENINLKEVKGTADEAVHSSKHNQSNGSSPKTKDACCGGHGAEVDDGVKKMEQMKLNAEEPAATAKKSCSPS